MSRSWYARVSIAALSMSLAGVGLLTFTATWPSQIVLCTALCFVPYTGLLLWDPALSRRAALRWALALSALVGLIMVAGPTLLSDDLYRYLWDGRVLAAGIDPYLYAPDDPALASLRDESWSHINNPEIPTIYPPLSQLLFAVAHGVAHAPWSVKALALCAHLATVPLVGLLAGDRAPRAMLLYALNPLVLVEAASSGHVDVVAGLALVAFVVALSSRRPWVAALLAAAASGVKLIGLVVAPLVALRGRRAAALAVVLAALPMIPLLGAGSGSETTGGLGQYARRWRGNEGPFVVLEAGVAATLTQIGRRNDAAAGHVAVPALREVLVVVEGTALDPRTGVIGDKKGVPDVADFEIGWLAGVLARVLSLLLVLGLAGVLVARRAEPLVAVRWVLLATLLLAPQIHPWYLLWLLPVEIALGRLPGVAWSALVLVAYAPLDGWLQTRQWVEPTWARAVEFGGVIGLIALEVGLGRASTTSQPQRAGVPAVRKIRAGADVQG